MEQEQDVLKACLEEKDRAREQEKHDKEALQSALHAGTNRGKTMVNNKESAVVAKIHSGLSV